MIPGIETLTSDGSVNVSSQLASYLLVLLNRSMEIEPVNFDQHKIECCKFPNIRRMCTANTQFSFLIKNDLRFLCHCFDHWGLCITVRRIFISGPNGSINRRTGLGFTGAKRHLQLIFSFSLDDPLGKVQVQSRVRPINYQYDYPRP